MTVSTELFQCLAVVVFKTKARLFRCRLAFREKGHIYIRQQMKLTRSVFLMESNELMKFTPGIEVLVPFVNSSPVIEDNSVDCGGISRQCVVLRGVVACVEMITTTLQNSFYIFPSPREVILTWISVYKMGCNVEKTATRSFILRA